MGQELELDLDDKSSVGLSPNTVLPSHQYCVNVKKISKKGKPTGKDEFFTLKEGFAEIKFARFRSSSCKNHLSKPHGLEGNIETRRTSMYQSSEEVKNKKKMDTVIEGRKKIEISRRSDTSFTGSIVDSLCGSDDEGSGVRSPNSFIEICINSDVKNKKSTKVRGRDSINLKSRSDKVADSVINGNCCVEKDTVHSLQKSFSAKAEVSHLPSPLGRDCSSSPKVQFIHGRKRLNHITKSKSLRSPVSQIPESNEMKSSEKANIARNRTYQKSLLNDLSKTGKHSDIISEFINREIQYSGIASSPVHLHGNLKLENKHGVPFFEFKVKCPEDVFVAKTWRTGNAFNWVYTFHSIDNRKKSNATGLGYHDFDKDSSTVAQMLVSCNLCSELEGKVFDNSMLTEFVLYDFTHSRQSVSREKKSFSEQDASKTLKASRVEGKEDAMGLDENHSVKNKLQDKSLPSNVEFDDLNSFPCSPTECHSNLEIAAIVLQIPFYKRESLKYKRGDIISGKEYSNIRDLSAEIDRKSFHHSKIQEQLKVVIPNGNHGLPNAENRGPSSLLHRLRYGGGCDCGGWDMACPLILLGNPSIQFAEDFPLLEEHQPLELFVQGAKGSSPTFSMRRIEEGHYAVDFHAQLSALQAFSISVAILHGTSASSSGEHEKNQQSSQCSSLKMLLEDDAHFFFKSVTTTEKKSGCKNPKVVPRSYVLNPPFSPIARV
ncbi:hypothetical protein PHAVU_002G289500 [Phaseolus vulgaris]|uniref:Uncharacterized protein n=1 Tax=Phaseolus vulgaris TaxID=3885 RepID=V7CPB8_PHAVU|nr:hypothetical protein PHAVU_002G289500g [Phaseolus vulgaris]XP_007160063.1 hypothetical protein PHAVU_002G289500g [Phaseolus vulgaris]ESW32056.1 hypothetical protein PHAVU_002G289500g [Phaseolus vulgaris]ESW32057.1 hypothetical protein PHAVU_002G289500g [Phaseolus vulgaris]